MLRTSKNETVHICNGYNVTPNFQANDFSSKFQDRPLKLKKDKLKSH